MRWNLITSGFLCLLAVSYLDNIRGPLLPILARDLKLDYGIMSWFLIATNFSAVVMNHSMLALLKRFSERTLIIGLSAFAAVVGAVAGQVQSEFTLILFALCLGVLLAPTSSLANIFVMQGTDEKYRSRFFCGLHLNYALGSLLGPWAVSLVLGAGYAWYYAFHLSTIVFVGLILFYLKALGARQEAKIVEAPHARKKLKPFEYGICFFFAAYVVGEVLGSMWIATYLVEAAHIAPQIAAKYSLLFFVVMGLARGSCFIGMRPGLEKTVLIGCLALAMIVFTTGHLLKIPLAFSCFGILGPFYPVFLARVTKVIPDRGDTFAVVAQTFSQIGVALGHVAMGYLTKWIGITYSYWLPLGFIGLVLLVIPVYFRWESHQLKV